MPNSISSSCIDLQHLRFTVAAADHGSFRQAAEAVSIRQSTLSRSIRQLEHSIGIVLFERSSGGVKPTPEGRSVIRIARIILEEFETLVTTAKSARSGEQGRLAIGFCTSLSAGNLRASLLEFKQRFPQIEVVTVERSQTRLVTALRNGVLDALIVTEGISKCDNRSLPLWSERILVILPDDHVLTERDCLYWTDLRQETVLLSQYDPGREFEQLLVSKLISPEDRPKIARHDVSRGIVKSLVSMKFGISLVLESDVGATFPGVEYRELRDGAGPSRLGYSAHWRADNENPALAAFVRLLCERYPTPQLL